MICNQECGFLKTWYIGPKPLLVSLKCYLEDSMIHKYMSMFVPSDWSRWFWTIPLYNGFYPHLRKWIVTSTTVNLEGGPSPRTCKRVLVQGGHVSCNGKEMCFAGNLPPNYWICQLCLWRSTGLESTSYFGGTIGEFSWVTWTGHLQNSHTAMILMNW